MSTLENLIFMEQEGVHDHFVLKVHDESQEVAHAIYHYFEGAYYLTWIETKEEFKGQGIARLILTRLCHKALKNDYKLIIMAVDDETVNDFYHPWFCMSYSGDNPDAVFNALLDKHQSPALILTPEIISQLNL